MAKSSFGSAAKKSGKRRLITWALKGTAACALLWGSYNYYVPEATRGAMEQKIAEVTGLGDETTPVSADALNFTFTNDNQPTILGEKTESAVLFDQTGAVSALAESWASAVGRHSVLGQNPGNASQFDRWLGQLDHLRGKSISEQATGVDALVDAQIKYMSDAETYGAEKAGYFASPMETLAKRQGDCEDFAILKYFALRHLGVPADKMFVVAVAHDGQTLDHVTLMVDIRQPGILTSAWENTAGRLFSGDAKTDFMILDNDGAAALVKEGKSAYKPFMIMNETGVWSVPANSQMRIGG